MSEKVRILVTRNGPYVVTGPAELRDADGRPCDLRPPAALCRCGASATKPFCDGTHSQVGFKAAERAVPQSRE